MTGPPWVEVPFEVQRPQAGLRVDAFLALRLQRYSRTEIQRLIAAGRVSLRGRPARASARLAAGDRVIVSYPRREEPPCEHRYLPVVFEDSCLLAAAKPAGVLSHPTDKVLHNAATTILARQYPALKLHLLHRLDRETSGVLLMAKDSDTARELSERFAGRGVLKEYLAIVSGQVGWRRYTADFPLGPEGREILVRQRVGGGQAALTDFVRVAAGPEHSLVRALPRTGRLHQIRVHLSHLGHPVLGDKLYTGDGSHYLKAVRRELTQSDLEALGSVRQMLHAHRITLSHPRTGRELRIAAPPPSDFRACLDRVCPGAEL